jgi:hypothetical protein
VTAGPRRPVILHERPFVPHQNSRLNSHNVCASTAPPRFRRFAGRARSRGRVGRRRRRLRPTWQQLHSRSASSTPWHPQERRAIIWSESPSLTNYARVTVVLAARFKATPSPDIDVASPTAPTHPSSDSQLAAGADNYGSAHAPPALSHSIYYTPWHDHTTRAPRLTPLSPHTDQRVRVSRAAQLRLARPQVSRHYSMSPCIILTDMRASASTGMSTVPIGKRLLAPCRVALVTRPLFQTPRCTPSTTPSLTATVCGQM